MGSVDYERDERRLSARLGLPRTMAAKRMPITISLAVSEPLFGGRPTFTSSVLNVHPFQIPEPGFSEEQFSEGKYRNKTGGRK